MKNHHRDFSQVSRAIHIRHPYRLLRVAVRVPDTSNQGDSSYPPRRKKRDSDTITSG